MLFRSMVEDPPPVPDTEDEPETPWPTRPSGLPTHLTIRALEDSPIGRAFVVASPRGGLMRVELFDLQGRALGVVADGPRAAGTHVLPWDTRMTGAAVTRGLVFARVSVDGLQAVTRFVITR